MTLKEYVQHMQEKGEHVNLSTIAKEIPCTPAYMSMIAGNKANPSYQMAKRIELITNGLVPKTNWYNNE